jgi:hypothetical protein
MKVIPVAGRLDCVHGQLQEETSKDHWVDVLQKRNHSYFNYKLLNNSIKYSSKGPIIGVLA